MSTSMSHHDHDTIILQISTVYYPNHAYFPTPKERANSSLSYVYTYILKSWRKIG